LISETYVYAIIIAVAALIIAFIIANLIKFQGGKSPKDHLFRRNWFILIGLLTPISFFLFNAIYVSSFILRPPLLAKFTTNNIWATLSVLGIYLLFGVLSMLIMRSSKWGTIVGKSKK
jgi:hypothetical protein